MLIPEYPKCGNDTNEDLIQCEIAVKEWSCKTVAQLNVYVKRSSTHPQTKEFKELENLPPHCAVVAE